MSQMETSNLTINRLKKMFAEGKRFDNRKLLEYRDIEVSLDVSNKAEGSARVRIGKSDVIVGVKMQVGVPYPDSPNKGSLMVSGDLLPLASPRFEHGPPKFEAIELPRVVDRAIRESGMIPFEKLVLTPGEKVWTVIVDIYPINDDGNIIDASSIAAAIALKNTCIPELDKDGKIDYEKKATEKLPLLKDTIPLIISCFKLGDSLILDPTREEEESCDMRIIWGISKWDGQYMINACQKSGKKSVPISQDEIEKQVSLLADTYEGLIKKLKKYL